MNLNPKKTEIDHHTIKLMIGVIAISLATLTSVFSGGSITSISASYHETDLARNIFVGFLFVISALLLSYNGRSTSEFFLSKTAAIAAIGVALFPCSCDNSENACEAVYIVPYVHYVCAAIMFLILVFFCYLFYKRASEKGYLQARIRALIYVLCGLVIIFSIAVIAYDAVTEESIRKNFKRVVFYGEAAALVAFGVAWLTASRVLPIITNTEERYSIFAWK